MSSLKFCLEGKITRAIIYTTFETKCYATIIIINNYFFVVFSVKFDV